MVGCSTCVLAYVINVYFGKTYFARPCPVFAFYAHAVRSHAVPNCTQYTVVSATYRSPVLTACSLCQVVCSLAE